MPHTAGKCVIVLALFTTHVAGFVRRTSGESLENSVEDLGSGLEWEKVPDVPQVISRTVGLQPAALEEDERVAASSSSPQFGGTRAAEAQRNASAIVSLVENAALSISYHEGVDADHETVDSGSAVEDHMDQARSLRSGLSPSRAGHAGNRSNGSLIPLDGFPPGSDVFPGVAVPSSPAMPVPEGPAPTGKQIAYALGGGTGGLQGPWHSAFDRDVSRRMRYQNKAVLLIMLAVYIATLSVGASMTYRQAMNDSPVMYYADPRFHNIVTEDQELDSFVDSFASVPKDVQLQVTGFVPMPDPIPNGVEWNGQEYHVAFTFSLDLSPWVVRAQNEDVAAEGLRLQDGVVEEDRVRLASFLAWDGNDLASVEVVKQVAWDDWEELATNIKHRIRQRGFTGVISVHQGAPLAVNVYKNKTWANFMHSRLTKVLCALSVLLWVVYLPYVWLRSTKLSIRARYKVDIPVRQYWDLISDQLCSDGFYGGVAPPSDAATS